MSTERALRIIITTMDLTFESKENACDFHESFTSALPLRFSHYIFSGGGVMVSLRPNLQEEFYFLFFKCIPLCCQSQVICTRDENIASAKTKLLNFLIWKAQVNVFLNHAFMWYIQEDLLCQSRRTLFGFKELLKCLRCKNNLIAKFNSTGAKVQIPSISN
jgi:hypothetical protein